MIVSGSDIEHDIDNKLHPLFNLIAQIYMIGVIESESDKEDLSLNTKLQHSNIEMSYLS